MPAPQCCICATPVTPRLPTCCAQQRCCIHRVAVRVPANGNARNRIASGTVAAGSLEHWQQQSMCTEGGMLNRSRQREQVEYRGEA